MAGNEAKAVNTTKPKPTATNANPKKKVQLSKSEATIATGNHSMKRINFLYLAANLTSGLNPALSAFYGDTLLNTAKKSVSRLSPAVKRTICPRCHTPLVAGLTSEVNLKSGKRAGDGKTRMEITCGKCEKKKSFLVKNKVKKASSENVR